MGIARACMTYRYFQREMPADVLQQKCQVRQPNTQRFFGIRRSSNRTPDRVWRLYLKHVRLEYVVLDGDQFSFVALYDKRSKVIRTCTQTRKYRRVGSREK